MSWVGATTGLPSAGESRLAVESIIVRASSWAAVESGTWTAIWSPSKSALNAVQSRGAVQQDRVVLDDLFEHVPDLGPDALDDALGALDVVGEALLDELAHDERLEHVGQGLEAVVAGAGDRTAAAAVVDQGVARLLEHPLLVADDDLGRAELEEPLEAVVAVDHAPVQVVEVRRREPAAVELHHRAHVGRDDRQDREDHPLRAVARAAERLDQAQALDRLLAPLAGA